jgi:hypothetical protein
MSYRTGEPYLVGVTLTTSKVSWVEWKESAIIFTQAKHLSSKLGREENKERLGTLHVLSRRRLSLSKEVTIVESNTS